jgi:GTPase SAR1 family protein
VYDVSNRESFEALPRWLDELENYVPPEVVKIVVGNKLDKVKLRSESIYPSLLSSPLITVILLPADR